MKGRTMTAESCCSKLKKEQLYMLELLVDRLNLNSEKIQEIGSACLTIKLEFLDFPPFEIKEEEFWSSKKRNEKQTTLSTERKSRDGLLDFSSGKSCLFPKAPNELVDAMRTQPLKLGVYKSTEKKICSPKSKEIPICKSEVPLSGCLCDQVSMSMNDVTHRPKPYTLHNTWNLIDEQGKPSGTILLFLRLTCLGNSIVTQFAVKNESFLFKGTNSSNEFQCSRVPIDDEEKDNADAKTDGICLPDGYQGSKMDSSPKPRSVIGLAPICQELAKRDGGPLEVVPPLNLSTHRMVEQKMMPKNNVGPIKSDHFAECVCRPGGTFLKRMTREFPCGKRNCMGGLCTGATITKSLGGTIPDGSSKNPCYNGSCCSGDPPNYCNRPRMRGGGCWKEEVEKPNDFRPKYQEDNNPGISTQSIENLISGACSSPHKTGTSKKPGCGCFGKTGTGAMGLKSMTTKNGFGCSNEPCHGVDCLIRAFKETQDFVDSIGKTPGFAGLGLMDPAESPYFGRDRDENPTTCDAKSPTYLTKHPSIVHHPRNLQMRKTASNVKTTSTIPPVQGIVPTVHRDHTFRPLDPLITGRTKKKNIEEKCEKQKEIQELLNHQITAEIESSPCGEPRCKSTRKKSPDELTIQTLSEPKLQETAKKLLMANTKSNSQRSKARGRIKSLQGPAGDRPSHQSRQTSQIRVSKKIMRLVNAMRDPRFSYGHKKCIEVRVRVPGNMGWLWNSSEFPGGQKLPIGWKPGAISKFVWERMQHAKSKSIESGSTNEIRTSTPTSKGKRSKSMKSKSFLTLGKSQWGKNRMHDKDDDEIELPPTLHIHRKDGTYYVTMYPVKGKSTNEEAIELEEKTKPLQFKITKNRDEEEASSSSTGSDMEIEFSPPAAIHRYKQKAPVVHQDTQVHQQEIADALKVTTGKPQSKANKAKKVKIKK